MSKEIDDWKKTKSGIITLAIGALVLVVKGAMNGNDEPSGKNKKA